MNELRAPCPRHGPQAFAYDAAREVYVCPACPSLEPAEGVSVVTAENLHRNPDGGEVETWGR